jgi:cell division protein FtsI/penicillin-binding protein 2
MDDVQTAQAWRIAIRRRLLFTAAVFVIWAVGIETRLVYLQVYDHDAQVAKATEQRNSTLTVPGRRGSIVDRHGKTLAMSVGAESVYAVRSLIEVPELTVTAICNVLLDCAPDERKAMLERIRLSPQKRTLLLRRPHRPARCPPLRRPARHRADHRRPVSARPPASRARTPTSRSP